MGKLSTYSPIFSALAPLLAPVVISWIPRQRKSRVAQIMIISTFYRGGAHSLKVPEILRYWIIETAEMSVIHSIGLEQAYRRSFRRVYTG